jgi:DNA modification methylase
MDTTQTWKIGDCFENYGAGVDADNLMGVASILRIFPEISRILKDGRFFVCYYDNRILPFLFDAIKGTNLVYRKQIYLYRRWGNANRWVGWMQTTDPCCIFVKGINKPFDPGVKNRKVKHDCYVKDKPESENTGHPAQKPLEMVKDIVSWCSNEGDIVLDPYCGSGTTLKACQQLNRNCIGFESNPQYDKMISKRLKQNNHKLTDYNWCEVK